MKNKPYILIILLLISGCYYDSSNASRLKKQVIIRKPNIEKEIKYITGLKNRVEHWEQYNKPKVIRDGFNPIVNDSQYDKPVRGGFLNVQFGVEPKAISILDNSSVSSIIASYVFNSLLTTDPETFKVIPSLAKSYKAYDIVWLKGYKKDSVFKEKGENNYIAGNVDEDNIKWDKHKKRILAIPIEVNGKRLIIGSNELRYRVDKADNYTRAYDRAVVFKFTLRDNVKWHDGHPLNVDDVIFSLEILKNPYIHQLTHLRSYYSLIKAWTKDSNNTITIYFDKQYFKAVDFAGGFTILPKHIYLPDNKVFTKKELARHFTSHEVNHAPIGTGPYYMPSKLLSNRSNKTGWKSKKHIMLIRNDDYFQKDKRAYLKRIYFKFITNPETSFIELKNGNIDFMPSMSAERFFNSSNSDRFKAKFAKAIYYTGGFSYIGYNMKKAYFRDAKVRTAFTMLLNRKRVLKSLYYGMGKVVSGSQYYFGPAYNHDVKPYDYDRERAIDLLNQSGWVDTDGDGFRDKNGIPFEVQLLYPQGSQSAQKIYAFLYEELRGVGIKIHLTRLEWSVFLEHLSNRKFDLCILGWGTPIESDPYQIWHSSQWANRGSNHVGFNNTEADSIIEKARRAINPIKRYKLYFRFHEVLHKEQPYLFLYTIPVKAVYNNRYRNVKFYRGRPGYILSEWFIPKALQTKEELKAELKN